MSGLKAFFIFIEGDDAGVGVVAETYYEAKKLACAELGSPLFELRSMSLPKANIEGLGKGPVAGIEGLKRGFYGSVEDACPICFGDKNIEIHEIRGKKIICCIDCYDEKEAKS